MRSSDFHKGTPRVFRQRGVQFFWGRYDGPTVVGFVTTKKRVGNAVMRNRARRVYKEAMRAFVARFPDGYRVVVLPQGEVTYTAAVGHVDAFMKHVG